jgi:hypothetical protein
MAQLCLLLGTQGCLGELPTRLLLKGKLVADCIINMNSCPAARMPSKHWSISNLIEDWCLPGDGKVITNQIT